MSTIVIRENVCLRKEVDLNQITLIKIRNAIEVPSSCLQHVVFLFWLKIHQRLIYL